MATANVLYVVYLQFVSELLDTGSFIRDYGSKQEQVNLNDIKGDILYLNL